MVAWLGLQGMFFGVDLHLADFIIVQILHKEQIACATLRVTSTVSFQLCEEGQEFDRRKSVTM